MTLAHKEIAVAEAAIDLTETEDCITEKEDYVEVENASGNF